MEHKTVVLVEPADETTQSETETLEGLGFQVIPYERVEAAAIVVRQTTGVLQVTDYGVGFPEGFGIDSSTGTGLMLVGSLVEQLDGTIELDSSGGNTIRITFPLNLASPS